MEYELKDYEVRINLKNELVKIEKGRCILDTIFIGNFLFEDCTIFSNCGFYSFKDKLIQFKHCSNFVNCAFFNTEQFNFIKDYKIDIIINCDLGETKNDSES
jgi:hypothetical protein